MNNMNRNFNNQRTNSKREERLILMSIMTYYADQILDGTKGFEFRKSPLRISDLNKTIYLAWIQRR